MVSQVFIFILLLASVASAAPTSDSDSSELLNPKGFGKNGKLPTPRKHSLLGGSYQGGAGMRVSVREARFRAAKRQKKNEEESASDTNNDTATDSDEDPVTEAAASMTCFFT